MTNSALSHSRAFFHAHQQSAPAGQISAAPQKETGEGPSRGRGTAERTMSEGKQRRPRWKQDPDPHLRGKHDPPSPFGGLVRQAPLLSSNVFSFHTPKQGAAPRIHRDQAGIRRGGCLGVGVHGILASTLVQTRRAAEQRGKGPSLLAVLRGDANNSKGGAHAFWLPQLQHAIGRWGPDWTVRRSTRSPLVVLLPLLSSLWPRLLLDIP